MMEDNVSLILKPGVTNFSLMWARPRFLTSTQLLNEFRGTLDVITLFVLAANGLYLYSFPDYI